MKIPCWSVVAVLWLLVSFCSASIFNPSFELEHHGLMPSGTSTSSNESWGMPDGWQWRKQGNMNGHGEGLFCGTDGKWQLYLFASRLGPHQTGDYLEFYQTVDLSGFGTLKLDVQIPSTVTYAVPYVSINNEKLWSSSDVGWHSLELNIARFGANSEIELGVIVLQPFGSSAEGWSYFDNLQLVVPEPATFGLLSLGGLFLSRRKK